MIQTIFIHSFDSPAVIPPHVLYSSLLVLLWGCLGACLSVLLGLWWRRGWWLLKQLLEPCQVESRLIHIVFRAIIFNGFVVELHQVVHELRGSRLLPLFVGFIDLGLKFLLFKTVVNRRCNFWDENLTTLLKTLLHLETFLFDHFDELIDAVLGVSHSEA